MEFLLKFDYIGPIPQLFIKKKARYQSYTGGLLTIILGILSILVFIGFGYDLFDRKNPISFLSKELNSRPKLNSTEPFFLFGPHLPFGERIENFEQQFRIKFRYVNLDGVSLDRKGNLTFIKEYQMIPCSQTNKYKENFYNIKDHLILPIEDYYCIPDNMTLPMEYKFGSVRFGYYGVYMDFCSKMTKDSSSCYSIEDVQKKHSKLPLHFIYLDSFIDPKDYQNPIKYIYHSNLILGNTNAQRIDYYYFRNIQLITDLGWITDYSEVKTTFQLSYSDNTMVSPAIDSLFYFIISMDDIWDIYVRKYLKLQAVLANAGGFVKFCLLIATFFNNFLIRRTMIESIYLALMEKYENKIEFSSNPLNSPVKIVQLKSQTQKNNNNTNNIKDNIIQINNNSINDSNMLNINNNANNNGRLSKFFIKHSEQSNVILDINKLKFDYNPFTRKKDEYKRLTWIDRICISTFKFSNQNSLKVLKFLEDDLK